MIILGLAACRPGGSGFRCDGEICIHLEIAEPVKALEPTLVTVTVETGETASGLGVSLIGGEAGAITRLARYPENAKVTYQDKVSVDWQIDAEAGQAYVFSAYVIFDQPEVSYGVASYQVRALAVHPSMGVGGDSVSIYLDAKGNQIERNKALEMEFPLPTLDSTLAPKPTATERPTLQPSPTEMPTRTPTPTRIMGYPARTLVATPTLSRAYPEP